MDALGLSPASSGNLSLRVGDDDLVISASGSQLGHLDQDTLSVVSIQGELRSGPKPSKELPLHLAFYRRDPGYRAIVHLHSPYAVAVSCLTPWSEHSAIPPLTPYFVMRVGAAPLIPYAPPGSDRLGEELAAMGGDFRAALLQNHGPIVAHSDLDAAIDAAVELEETARLLVLLGDRGRPLSADDVTELSERFDVKW